MARPREFDTDAALDGAIAVFREHGFEGTSAQMLVDAMRIGRQSLYAAFGDKWQLYCSAARRYGMGECAVHFDALRSGARAIDGIYGCCIASLRRPISRVSVSARFMSSAPPVPTSRRSTRCWQGACAEPSPPAFVMRSGKVMSPLASTPKRSPSF